MKDPTSEASTMTSRGQRGTIEQLSNGRWKARYREDGRDGKRPAKIHGTRAEAAAWLREQLDGQRRCPNERFVAQACFDYLAAHEADEVTLKKLRRQLSRFIEAYGERTLSSLEGQSYELAIFRKTVPPGYRHDVFRAVRQAMAQWVRWGWMESSPAAEIKNPRPRRKEVRIPPWEVVLLIAEEIDERYQAMPVFAASSGLRIEEWSALGREHLDVDGRLVRVRRVYSLGRLLELGADGSKSWRQRRDVPLRLVALQALAAVPTRIDTPLLFPAPRGDYLDSDRWRERFWRPALRAAGVDYFPPKDLRHVYASESIAAGMDLFTLSRRMGTSLKEIDETYGHLVHDAHERELELLDGYDAERGRIAEAGP